MSHPQTSTQTCSSSRQELLSKPSFVKQKMKCFYCKKRGHLVQEFREKKQDIFSSHSTTNVQQQLYVTTLSLGRILYGMWILVVTGTWHIVKMLL